MTQPTPSEIGQFVTDAIEEASAKRQLSKVKAWKIFGEAYEEHEQRYGSLLPLLTALHYISDNELSRAMSQKYERQMQERIEFQLSRLYDYLWFGEK